MKIEIVANEFDLDAGLLLTELERLGPRIRFRLRESPRSWASDLNADLLLHLGSSWSVYWENVSDNVAAEIALLRHGMSRGIPIFGVCFGAQIFSQACGGVVKRGKKVEIGWHSVDATEGGAPLGGRWMQWHYDSFTAPEGVEVLAVNDAGIQAIRRGRTLGVQFHPEATEGMVARWMEGEGVAELAALGVPPTDLIAETRNEVKRTASATKSLVKWFLDEVAQGPALAPPSN